MCRILPAFQPYKGEITRVQWWFSLREGDSRFMMRRIIRSLLVGGLSAINSVSAVNAWGLSECYSLLFQIEQEQKRADAFVAIGEWMIFDDKVEKVHCLFFTGSIEWFSEHGLFDIAKYSL